MDATAQELVQRLGMSPLPVEATFFVSTYRSAADTASGGPVGTAMIGLFSDDPPSRSLFHRLAFDEVWHFYGGDPLRLVLLHPDLSSAEVVMGSDVLAGQLVQYVVPAGVWQAGELVGAGRWALFGCTMAPGFIGHVLRRRPDRRPAGHPSAARGRHPSTGHTRRHDTAMPTGFAT